MVRPAEIIRREIDSLKQTTATLAAEFNQLYTNYLDSLGVATRHQLVMAAYHLCTQIYPEGFLALSVSQQEKLQRQIRQLGQQAKAQLQHLLEPEAPSPEQLEVETTHRHSLGGPTLEDTPESGELADQSSDLTQAQAEAGSEVPPWLTGAPSLGPEGDGVRQDRMGEHGASESPANPIRRIKTDDGSLPSLLKSMVMAALAEEMSETWGDRLFTGEDLTPTQLAKQHIFLEQEIRRVLQRLSKQANQLLQAAQVLPNLPEAVLDAASESEAGPSRGRSAPNVLNVLVAMAASPGEDLDTELDQDPVEEAEEDEEDEPREGMMTHLAAIHLRLSDIEFADVQASLWRSKLRTALGRLRKLGKQYQKVQRELAIAEAEQAWRAVWYDDSPR